MVAGDLFIAMLGRLNEIEQIGVSPGRYGPERERAWVRGRMEAVDEVRAALAEEFGDG